MSICLGFAALLLKSLVCELGGGFLERELHLRIEVRLHFVVIFLVLATFCQAVYSCTGTRLHIVSKIFTFEVISLSYLQYTAHVFLGLLLAEDFRLCFNQWWLRLVENLRVFGNPWGISITLIGQKSFGNSCIKCLSRQRHRRRKEIFFQRQNPTITTQITACLVIVLRKLRSINLRACWPMYLEYFCLIGHIFPLFAAFGDFHLLLFLIYCWDMCGVHRFNFSKIFTSLNLGSLPALCQYLLLQWSLTGYFTARFVHRRHCYSSTRSLPHIRLLSWVKKRGWHLLCLTEALSVSFVHVSHRRVVQFPSVRVAVLFQIRLLCSFGLNHLCVITTTHHLVFATRLITSLLY